MICKNYRTLPQKEGYYLAKADYHIQERPGQRAGAVLVIDVNEGNKLYIKEVVIDGLHELDQGDMDKYLALKPRNILSWFTGSGVLKDEYLEKGYKCHCGLWPGTRAI